MAFNPITPRHIIHKEGQAEATNKTLIKNLKKICESHKFSDWPEKLIDALWAYRTSI